MATRVFSCLLLVTVLFAEKALLIGGEGDGGALPETQNCTVFFCSFVLAPCQPYSVLASYLTGAIDITFSANLSRCTGEMITGQVVVSQTFGMHASTFIYIAISSSAAYLLMVHASLDFVKIIEGINDGSKNKNMQWKQTNAKNKQVKK